MALFRSGRQRLQTLLIFLSILCSFAYGVAVGVYHLFPFEHLRMAKDFVIGEQAAQGNDMRRVNYQNRIDIHQLSEANSDVVMIGDSITEIAEWSEFFPGVLVANRGMGGDTTERVLQRLDSIYRTRAGTAFLLVGINDFIRGNSVEFTYSNYEQIIEDLLSHGIQPIIQSTILAGEARKDLNPHVTELNDRLRVLAARKKVRFIDLNAQLAQSGVLSAEFTTDDIHLNAAGYDSWKKVIRPVIMQDALLQDDINMVIATP